jgi:hypothetical protein
MNQTSNESERRHGKEYRLDREDMLGCTWTIGQFLFNFGSRKQDLLNECERDLN